MGFPPRPLEPEYDDDGRPVHYPQGHLGDGMDFGYVYAETFADSPERARSLWEGGVRQQIRALRESGILVSAHHDEEPQPVEALRIRNVTKEHGHTKVFSPRHWTWLKGQDWYLGGAPGSYFVALVRHYEDGPEEPLLGDDGEPARYGSREEASEEAERAVGPEGDYRVEYREPPAEDG